MLRDFLLIKKLEDEFFLLVSSETIVPYALQRKRCLKSKTQIMSNHPTKPPVMTAKTTPRMFLRVGFSSNALTRTMTSVKKLTTGIKSKRT